MPRIALALSILLFSGPASVRAEPSLQIAKDDTGVDVSDGGAPVLRYRYAEVPYKPYVEKLFSPDGVNVLRDAPSDHLHHHGLMFAVSVNDLNFWEEHNAPGREKHLEFTSIETDSVGEVRRAGLVEALDWVNPREDDLLHLHETRTVQAYKADDIEATLLTWTSEFAVPEGRDSSTLSGSNYFGLGMRFPVSMDTGGSFFNADGGVGVEGTHNHRSTWTAYTAKVEGKEVTVASFDAPANPRHPATWFTMDRGFAYLSATLNLAVEPLPIERGKGLTLRYGVAVWDGKASAETVEALYRKWVSLVAAEER